jgi:hypothetical protein
MPKKQGIWRQEWGRCDRCGFLHPLGMLSPQMGLLLCHCHGCYDNPLIWRRQIEIANILNTEPEDSQDQSERVYNDSSEIEFAD